MEMTTRSPRRTSSLRDLQNEVSRLFESVFPSPGNGDQSGSAVWAPRMDLLETEDRFHLRMDLPGISRDDVSITVEDNRLTIRGERTDEFQDTAESLIRTERMVGTFYRSVRLPKSVDEDEIQATFRDGVLAIELPKSEKSKPKKIQIS